MKVETKRYKIICLKCKSECTQEIESNNACGSDECCGPYEEWVETICPKCSTINTTEY